MYKIIPFKWDIIYNKCYVQLQLSGGSSEMSRMTYLGGNKSQLNPAKFFDSM